jgi:hypothetical protein
MEKYGQLNLTVIQYSLSLFRIRKTSIFLINMKQKLLVAIVIALSHVTRTDSIGNRAALALKNNGVTLHLW